MGKSSFLFLGLCFFYISTLADGNKYVVYLKDKANSQFQVENPKEFLSERSVARKTKFNIPITVEDIPVNDTYIGELQNLDLKVLYPSRWLNSVLVEATEDVISEVESLNFVKSVNYMAPANSSNGRKSRSRSGVREISTEPAAKESTMLQNRILGVGEMHKKGYKGEGMLIAIFDSGFLTVDESSFFSHVFSNNRIKFTKDFVNNSGNVYQYDTHGTRAFSTIAGYQPSEYIGVAHNADFILCVTEEVASEYKVEEYYWLMAAELADSLGADIISSSLAYSTFDDPTMDYEYNDLNGSNTMITKAAELAVNKGMIVVTSAGNDGNKSWRYINAPADGDSVLAIGAIDEDLQKSSFSSFGPTADGRIKPDLCALGSGVKVVTGENIFSSNGTSFSTPLVSGLAAGFWQAFPELSSFEVIELLKSTASNSSMPDTLIGYGVPNFIEAFNKASDIENTEESFIVYPNPVDGSKIFAASTGFLEIGKVTVNFVDFKGTLVKDLEIKVYNKNEPLEIDISDLREGYYLVKFIASDKKRIAKLIVL